MATGDRSESAGRPRKRKPLRPRKRKPPAPPPRSEVAAQSGYNIPKTTNVPPRHTVFTDPIPKGPALHGVQRDQRQRVRDAEEALPGQSVRLPRLPTLKSYTPAQRLAIIRQTTAAVQKAASRGELDPYLVTQKGEEDLWSRLGHLTDSTTRRAVHKYAGALRTQQALDDAKLGQRLLGQGLSQVAPTFENLTRLGAQARESGLEKALRAAGEIKPGGTPTGLEHQISGFLDDRIFNYAPGLRVAQIPVQLARATFEDPVGTIKSTARTAVESIAGIPQGIKAIFDDPGKALEAIGDDYSHRFGPLIEGDTEKFRRQVQEESGLTPFVLDAAAVGAPVGRLASMAARPAAVGRAAEALAAAHEPILSRALRYAHETANMQRPDLRFSAGEAGVVGQETSPNLFRAAGQRRLDTSRRRRFEKRAKAAGMRPGQGGKLERVPGAATDRRLEGLRPASPNEVLPISLLDVREAAPIRRLTGRVATDIGHAKSKGRVRLLTQRGRALAEIDKATRKLTDEERAALMPAVKYGLPAVRDAESRAQALAAIDRRLAQLKRERKQAGFKGTPIIHRETNDEVLLLLRRIRKDPEKYLTPALRDAVDRVVPGVQRLAEQLDPDLPEDRALIRRDTEQGKLLGVRRGPDEDFFRGVLEEVGLVRQARGQRTGPVELAESHGQLAGLLPEERPAAATKIEREAKKDLDHADRVLASAREELAHAQGRAEILSRNVDGTRAAEDAAARGTAYAGGGLGAAQAREAVDAAKAARDVAADAYAAAREVTRTVKRKDTMRLEPADAFDTRVRKAAEEAGLSEPGYWMSTPRPTETYSEAAIGTGGRAVARSKRYTGTFSDLGIETHTAEVLTKGVERNIKRRFSWALVNRNVNVHAFEWSRGKGGEGLTATQLLKELDERHIDAGSVAFVNTRIVEKRPTVEAGVERGRVVDQAEVEDAVLGEANQELLSARTSLQDVQEEAVQGQAMNRYLVMPKDVADELEHATRPDGAWARGLEIVLKQKPARILLGLFNVPWLSFQIASNAMLTGLGGGRNPLDVYGAHKWWRGLSDAEKDAIEVELGITHGRHFAMDQVHLGSTKDAFGPASHLVNFWQAYKKSRVGRSLHRANPLDAMFRADEAQNNFFRKVLFYNQAKKAAYREMGANWKSMSGLQGKLMSTLGRPPEELGGAIVKSGPVFEKHAKAVNDFLGNYLKFSNRERQLLSRNVMFYGYLRYSLRFAFWTMPVQHPVMTALLGNIGRLGAQEIKELFGVPSNYQLPTSMLAKVYFGSSPEQVREFVESDGKRGKLPGSVNIGRMNPGLNSITQMEGAQQIVGLVSPLYQALADQLFEESSFTGRDFRIKGQPTPAEAERPKNYYGSFWSTFVPGAPRNRILMADLLGLAYPYRLATKTGIPGVVDPMEGPQSDDSLLFDQRPMHYKDEDIRASIKRSIQADRNSGRQGLLANLLPYTPEPDLAPVIVAREREKEADEANKAMKKKPRRSRSKGGYRYGGSSSSSYKDRYGG